MNMTVWYGWNFRFLVTMSGLNSTSGPCTLTQDLTQSHTKTYKAYTTFLCYIVLCKLSITFTLYTVRKIHYV